LEAAIKGQDLMDNDTDAPLVDRFQLAARACGWTTSAMGLIVLFGWFVDMPALTNLRAGWVSMKPNTALSFLLIGAALVAASSVRSPSSARLYKALAGLVALLGGMTELQYLLSTDFGIDQLLMTIPTEALSKGPPGRMAQATATGFASCGLALMLLDTRWQIVSRTAALVAGMIGLLAVLGYAYDVKSLYGVGAYSSVALHTALGIVVVSMGTQLARPSQGWMSVVTSTTTGGLLARRLLPFAVTAPFVIGWLRHQAELQGLISTHFGNALVALTYTCCFLC
jgi:hypothetical protein